jgi:hypothetical protein
MACSSGRGLQREGMLPGLAIGQARARQQMRQRLGGAEMARHRAGLAIARQVGGIGDLGAGGAHQGPDRGVERLGGNVDPRGGALSHGGNGPCARCGAGQQQRRQQQVAARSGGESRKAHL